LIKNENERNFEANENLKIGDFIELIANFDVEIETLQKMKILRLGYKNQSKV
jgi:hypothetical protein